MPGEILTNLRRRSIEITSIDELDRKGCSDQEVIALAKENRRVIVTQDADFLNIASQGTTHCGIVFVRAGISIGDVERVLVLVHSALDASQMLNHIEYASALL